MTGVSSPYEVPSNPDIELITDQQSIEECVEIILKFINLKLKFKK